MPITIPPAFGEMPDDVAQELCYLSDTLDREVPSKQLDRNLIVASWNIRELGRSNGEWATVQTKSPKRNLGDITFIAEILSRFDVVALQEVQDNLEALRQVMYCLGPDWGFHVTDVTAGQAGDSERLSYLYDLRRVRPSGLAGELVLSPEDLGRPTADDGADADAAAEPLRAGPIAESLVRGLDQQLVKTPYIMSFTTGGRPFVLATVHILWGDPSDLLARAREVEALAKMLKRTVKRPPGAATDEFRSSLIALGDFNITDADDPIFKALTENGLQPDVETLDCPRGMKDRPGTRGIAYDQIAWFPKGEAGGLAFHRLSGNTFAWDKHILVGEPGDTSFRISDHYPLWLEFSVRQSA